MKRFAILLVLLLVASGAPVGALTGTDYSHLVLKSGPGFLDVREFRVVDSSVTDQTTQITAAIASATAQGCRLWFPPGTYCFKDIHITTNGVSIEGSDRSGEWTTLDADRGTSFLLATGGSYLFRLGSGTSDINGTSFRGVSFDGNGKIGGGIWNDYAVYTRIDGCTFYDCTYGIGMRMADRLFVGDTQFFSNTYSVYYDETVFTGSAAASALTFLHCHNRSNQHNIYWSACRTDFAAEFIGGYWAGASTGDDIYITGAANNLSFTGVNFENTEGTDSGKTAIIHLGQTQASGSVGISQVSLHGCLYFDNAASRPAFIRVEPSGSSTYPSVHSMNIMGCAMYNGSTTAPIIATQSTAVLSGTFMGNRAQSQFYPATDNWDVTQGRSALSTGLTIKNLELGTTCTASGVVTIKRVFPRSSYYTLTDSFSGGILTNDTSIANLVATLPPALLGTQYEVVNNEAYGITLSASAPAKIVYAGTAYSAVSSQNLLGGSYRVLCATTTAGVEWIFIPGVGTHTFTP